MSARDRTVTRADRDVADPLLAQYATAVRLSLAVQMVRSATPRRDVRTVWYAMTPASSKSEIEMDPRELSAVAKDAVMCTGKRCRQTTGAAEKSNASNQTPPISLEQTSQAPMSEGGAVGTSSCRRVGRSTTTLTSARKSAAASYTCYSASVAFAKRRL